MRGFSQRFFFLAKLALKLFYLFAVCFTLLLRFELLFTRAYKAFY